MDLPSCPACGQSVLDDDAAECPFCGASMSGKPVKRKPRPAATEPKIPTVDAAPQRLNRQENSEKETVKTAKSNPVEGDDAPFEIDVLATQRAVSLSPKPRKGRLHRVICPMCETPGFTAKKVAGHDVKCSNPECLVPIFTAPPLQKEKEEEAKVSEPSKKGVPVGVVLASVVGLLLLAGGGWFLFGRSDKPSPDPSRAPAEPLAQSNAAGNSTKVDPLPAQDDVPVATGTPRLSPTKIRDLALLLMVSESRSRETPANRKSFCRRQAAEAYAIVGDLKNARLQLKQLSRVGRDVPYYQIRPLTHIARKQIESGDQAGAATTLAECLQLAEKLPTFGEFRFQAVPELALSLAAAGKIENACKLLEGHDESDASAQLAAMLQCARASQTFDLDEVANRQALVEATAPLWVAVIQGLTFRGHTQQAQTLALSASDVEAVTDCCIVWGQTLVVLASRQSTAQPLPDFDAVVAQLSPAGKARYYANLCAAWLSHKNRKAAQAALDKANNAFNSIPIPREVLLPKQDSSGIRKLYFWKLPDPVPLRMAAVAACEIARVQSELEQTEQAQASLLNSLKFLRSISPTPTSALRRRAKIDVSRGAFMRGLLKDALDLTTDAQTRIAFNKYRNKSEEIKEASNVRFRLQLDLMQHALDWGLLDPVWDEIRARSGLSPETERFEPYKNKALPKLLAARYRAAGEIDKADEVEDFVGNSGAYDERMALQQSTILFMKSGDLKGAVNVIKRAEKNDFSRNPDNRVWRNQWTIQLACQLVKQDKVTHAFRFIGAFRNPLLREKAFETIGGMAGRLGAADEAWSFVNAGKLLPTDKVAICRGLIEGIGVSTDVENAVRSEPSEAVSDVSEG